MTLEQALPYIVEFCKTGKFYLDILIWFVGIAIALQVIAAFVRTR